MAKRARKTKKTEEDMAAIEADRIAAHEQTNALVGPNVQTSVFPDRVALELVEREPAELDEPNELEEEIALAEVEEEAKLPNSVVAEKFKLKYIANAVASGVAGKAAKRSNWDWLAQEIAAECLGEKEKINIDEFTDLLERNGVDYSRWTNRNKGWEGRFRMTGRVALQKVVANRGVLKKAMSESVPPQDWVEKYKTKA